MTGLMLPDELVAQINARAQAANLSPEDFLRQLLEQHTAPTKIANPSQGNPLENLLGLFDDDIDDMSVTVSKTLREYFREQDDDRDS